MESRLLTYGAAIAAAITVLYGHNLGDSVQALAVAVAGVIGAAHVHGLHAGARTDVAATAQVAVAKHQAAVAAAAANGAQTMGDALASFAQLGAGGPGSLPTP